MSNRKSRHTGTKADNQKRHFKSRLTERYGIYASDDDIGIAVADIGADRAEFYFKDSNRVSLYFVIIQGVKVLVAFDKSRKMFSTALPLPVEA